MSFLAWAAWVSANRVGLSVKHSYPCQKCLRLFDRKKDVGAEMKTGGMPVVADYSRSAHCAARGQTAASDSISVQSSRLSARIYLAESSEIDHSTPQELYRDPHLPTIPCYLT